jgi:hypothetical protein
MELKNIIIWNSTKIHETLSTTLIIYIQNRLTPNESTNERNRRPVPCVYGLEDEALLRLYHF